VLLHFNSSQMKRVSEVSMLFEYLLLQAKHTYLLDACVDNAVVHDFVRYLERCKNVRARWVRNTHVREHNRACRVVVNSSRQPATRPALIAAAVRQAVDALNAGERVVVSSTTKRFTDVLARELRARAPDKNVVVYNSDTDRAMLMRHALDPHAAWAGCDALVYSPTIGAGVSFELPHFHQLIAWIENSLEGATIDLAIQQLYRVRQLTTGAMTLYVQDTAGRDAEPTDYPIRAAAIEDWMDSKVGGTVDYMSSMLAAQCKALTATGPASLDDPNQQRQHCIVFDRRRLSYHVLKGIVYIKHKSLLHGTAILVHTLRTDYNIACEVVDFQPVRDAVDDGDAVAQRAKTYDAEHEVPFGRDLILRQEAYDALRERELQQTTPLTPRDRLALWIYDACVDYYGIETAACDAAFFDTFIGQATRAGVSAALATFYRAMRFVDLATRTSAEVRAAYDRKLAAIVNTEDRNMEMYRTRVRAFYEQGIEGARLLEHVFHPVDVHDALARRDELSLTPAQTLEGFQRWATDTTPNQFQTLLTHLGHDGSRCFRSKGELCNSRNAKKRAAFLTAVLDSCFGLSLVDYKAGVKNKKNALYGVKKVDAGTWHALIDVYHPASMELRPRPTASPFVLDASDEDSASVASHASHASHATADSFER
jgi:hypothetical protein